MNYVSRMRMANWIRIVAGGLLWSFVYNSLWGAAWIAFMRAEWFNATRAAHRAMPWTQEFWIAWIAMTVPLGIAISGYSASHRSSATRKGVHASLGLWALMTPAMVVLFQSLSARILTLDSVVDLFAALAAGAAAGWSQRGGREQRKASSSSAG